MLLKHASWPKNEVLILKFQLRSCMANASERKLKTEHQIFVIIGFLEFCFFLIFYQKE